MISIHALKAFVLKGLTLEVPDAAIHLILGANGAGKSTLLRTLAGLLTPEAGTVTVTGKAALLMQESDYQIFGETVIDDMTLTETHPSTESQKAALALAENFGLKPDAKTRSLSFGEKRKLALASLLITKPDVFLLDEPTASLDWPATKALLTDIERIQCENPKATFLIATHAPEDFLTISNLTASVLFNGELVVTGPIEAVRKAILENPAWGLRSF